MSSTWLTSRDSRSVSTTTLARNCWRCAAGMAASSSINSASARIEVSGVRSSWVTEDMKSSLSLSSPSSR